MSDVISFLSFFVVCPLVSLFGFDCYLKQFESSIHFKLNLFVNPWRGHASCFHNSAWCVLVADATEQLLPGPQGIAFNFKNCCHMKWYSLDICLKILVVKMFKMFKISDPDNFGWGSFAV